MNPQYLNEPVFTKKGLMENVLGPNGFDGVKADQDIYLLAREEQKRKFARQFLVGNSLAGLFAVYNLTRFTRLSSSGKQAAVVGTFVCALNQIVTLKKLGMFRPATTTPAEQQQ